MATIKYYVKNEKLSVTFLLVVIKLPNLWQTRANTYAFMPMYILLIFLIYIFMNINEYVKTYGKNGKTTYSGSHWGLYAHFLPKLYLMEANMSMRVYLMKKNECNYGQAYLNCEFLIGFHGNPASLYYEFDTCSQTLCKSQPILGIQLSNRCQIKAETLAFLLKLFW